MPGLNMRTGVSAAILGCALLAACNGDKAATDAAQADNGLPKPGAVSGSVTGMPNPGVAASRPQRAAEVEAPGDLLVPVPAGSMDGLADAEPGNVEYPDEIELQPDPTLTEPAPEADAAMSPANQENGDATVPPPQP